MYDFTTTPCSVECGIGTQVEKTLECRLEIIQGKEVNSCVVSSTEVACTKRRCQGSFGEWSAWSDCSKSCLKSLSEISVKNRSRPCYSKDESLCLKGATETKACKDIQLCNLQGIIG